MIRFARAVRGVHHVTALLMLVCLVTAAMLYVPALAEAVGRRHLVRTIHVLAGFGLPVPALLGWASRAFREDVRRLDRFSPDDWRWLRGRDRRATVGGRGIHPVGKFNAGQKLNAAFVAGAILVMLGTGWILAFPHPWPDTFRTGATFVHDWLTLAVFAVILGHLWYALRDPGALSGMFIGRVTPEWAARHHPAWLDETAAAGTRGMAGPDQPDPSSKGNPGRSGELTAPAGNTEEGKDDLSPRRS
ncbi:cytochrome b/b6 domain-containing protein [Actinoallomurus spadix]|uniref:Formate dehydrogenase subunit gamma n=1 Tax=Actinoallomurus spadix TaxID=79912 RepID=A0ABP3FYG6_9ACTN|nr:cytochrome b/b6 domain-containing protein [Actinoallomurus spadix]MCO5986328.1 cytochrome b/b6 domain-containing protein [Actinoallomurus spadix]